DLAVQPLALPPRKDDRLPLRQPRLHRKVGARKEDGRAVIGLGGSVGHWREALAGEGSNATIPPCRRRRWWRGRPLRQPPDQVRGLPPPHPRFRGDREELQTFLTVPSTVANLMPNFLAIALFESEPSWRIFSCC